MWMLLMLVRRTWLGKTSTCLFQASGAGPRPELPRTRPVLSRPRPVLPRPYPVLPHATLSPPATPSVTKATPSVTPCDHAQCYPLPCPRQDTTQPLSRTCSTYAVCYCFLTTCGATCRGGMGQSKRPHATGKGVLSTTFPIVTRWFPIQIA